MPTAKKKLSIELNQVELAELANIIQAFINNGGTVPQLLRQLAEMALEARYRQSEE